MVLLCDKYFYQIAVFGNTHKITDLGVGGNLSQYIPNIPWGHTFPLLNKSTDSSCPKIQS